MTIGIYSLYWEEQDLIYIGQSQNIEHRVAAHISLLKRCKHSNYKLQNTYNKYGAPSDSILEVCSLSDITECENYWINDFNSIKLGLNILAAERSNYGTSSGNAKFSKNTILKVFSLLYSKTMAYSFISERLSVPYTLIRDIKTGVSHIWLKDEYPTQYMCMLQRKTNTLRRRGSNSSYSKIQILKVFSLLYSTKLSYPEISKRVRVHESLPKSIKLQKSQKYLSSLYPEKYLIMINR